MFQLVLLLKLSAYVLNTKFDLSFNDIDLPELRCILQRQRRRIWTRIKCTHQYGRPWTWILPARAKPGVGLACILAVARNPRGTRWTPREPWPGRRTIPGVSLGRVTTPAGLGSRAYYWYSVYYWYSIGCTCYT